MNTFNKLSGKLFDERNPKRRLWGYMLVVTLVFAQTLFYANSHLNNGIYLKVESMDARYSSTKAFNLPENNTFKTDSSGDLFWHPKSFMEALLLDTINGNGIFDIFQVVLFYAFVGILFFVTQGSNPNRPFSHNLYQGFMMIALFIMLSGALISYGQLLVGHYFRNITEGQFVLKPDNDRISFYTISGAMLFFMLRFPKQALDMQKEQELTI